MLGMVSPADCQAVRVSLTPYLRGTLPLPDTQRISAHLRACVTCRAATYSVSVVHYRRARGSSLLALPAGLVGIVGVTLSLLHGFHPMHPSVPTRPVGPSAIAPPVAVPQPQGFTAKPSAAYYLRLHVADAEAAHDAIGLIFRKSSVLEMGGPYAGRYYLTVMPRSLEMLWGALRHVGDPDAIIVGLRHGADTSVPAEACAVTLDVLSNR